MRKSTKTATELEALIRVEMEEIRRLANRPGNHRRTRGGYVEGQRLER